MTTPDTGRRKKMPRWQQNETSERGSTKTRKMWIGAKYGCLRAAEKHTRGKKGQCTEIHGSHTNIYWFSKCFCYGMYLCSRHFRIYSHSCGLLRRRYPKPVCQPQYCPSLNISFLIRFTIASLFCFLFQRLPRCCVSFAHQLQNNAKQWPESPHSRRQTMHKRLILFVRVYVWCVLWCLFYYVRSFLFIFKSNQVRHLTLTRIAMRQISQRRSIADI